MSSPETQTTTVSYHKIKWFLEAMTESVHLVKISWWPEEVSLKNKDEGEVRELEAASSLNQTMQETTAYAGGTTATFLAPQVFLLSILIS